METITYTTVRKSLAQTMENVCEDHEPIVITKRESEPVVLLSLEDYKALQETVYLIRSPKNAERLTQAIREIEEGKAIERDLL